MSVEACVITLAVSSSEKTMNLRSVEAIQEACTNQLHVLFDHRSVQLRGVGIGRRPGRRLQGRNLAVVNRRAILLLQFRLRCSSRWLHF